MPELPGMDCEVYFGNAEKPLPNWRDKPSPSDEDDAPLSDAERAVLIGQLGFDPAEKEEPEPLPPE